MKRPSVEADLKARTEIPDEDIEALIFRAIDLEAASATTEGISVDDLLAMGEELEIAPEYLEQAIAERYREEDGQVGPAAEAVQTKVTAQPPREDTSNILPTLALVGFAALVLLSWFMFSNGDTRPTQVMESAPSDTPNPPKAVQPHKPETPTTQPPKPRTEPRPAPAPEPADVAAMMKTIEGEWILDAYRGSRNGRIIDVPVAAERLNADRERWSIRPGGHYSRRMSGNLSFSGEFSLRPASADMKIHDAEGTTYVLHGRNVTSLLAGLDRPEDFYLVAMVGEDLLVHYVGTTLKLFERFPDGARFRRAR